MDGFTNEELKDLDVDIKQACKDISKWLSCDIQEPVVTGLPDSSDVKGRVCFLWDNDKSGGDKIRLYIEVSRNTGGTQMGFVIVHPDDKGELSYGMLSISKIGVGLLSLWLEKHFLINEETAS